MRLPRAIALFVVVAAAALATMVAALHADHHVSLGHGQLSSSIERGRTLFVRTCSGCHALRATASVGAPGPDLDQLSRQGLSPPLVRATIKQGVDGELGSMPAGLVGDGDARLIGAFLRSVAGCPRVTVEFRACTGDRR